MKTTVRFAAVVAPILVICAALTAASIHPASSNGLTVHEWGTFTSVAGEDGATIEWNTLGCSSDLPRFVNDYGYRGFKWRLQGTVRMETPVMYFYSSRELDAHVTVSFPKGLITEWYPQADYQVFQKSRVDGSMHRLESNLIGIDTSLRTLNGAMEWRDIKVQPNTSPAFPIEKDASRYYAARETDAAPLGVGDQHEKFLVYRGVGRFPVPLSASVSPDGKIVVENRGLNPVPNVILFENRGGRMGYRNAGAVSGGVMLDSPELDSSLPVLRQELQSALVAQGLFPKEARAMLETWRDSWFEEGSRLIYILPTAAVDGILPLQVEPAASGIVRVFVGRIELVTPETKRSVESAIARSDWPAVARYNRFLEPILARIYPGNTAAVNRVEQLYRSSGAAGATCL